MYNRNQDARKERPQYNLNLEQQLASQEKKTSFRRTVDHGNNMGRWYIHKSLGLANRQQPIGKIRPESSYLIDLLPSLAYSSSLNLDSQANSNNMAIMDCQTKFVHLSSNKVKHSINTVKWTPEGRRLVVASHSGEFTIWNGMTFNFETIMQAHDLPILSLTYSHNDEWLLSGDQSGVIKYWQPNFNNVNIINGHSNGIRDIAFSPNDSKFLTAGDDSSLKIWNFNNGKEERTLAGHHWEVKSADWHPNLGLIVSGSKDNLVKLWDPRSPNCITTLHGFKHTVNKTRFQTAGTKRLLATVSRDRSCRVFDLRTMKDILVLRDQDSDLSCVSWNPIHPSLLTTAAYNGSMNHYLLDSYIPDTASTKTKVNPYSTPSVGLESLHKIPYAHEKAIHALEYHPLGHLLCSAGSDKTARFWSRARPNDPMSFKDALYTDDKQGAWYYTVNNNINAVIEDPDAPAKATVSSPTKNGSKDEKPAPSFNLPGLNSLGNYGNGDEASLSGIPGLRG
ncbi:polyadenylation factor subunit 2 [Suhomyces tanzawaensis NRRL Y-17324]|uniref:Polyadenylation factor subunit 2 n=1 Tax=Suhomyces tanzawaensis NRRL Y-17324 TaxID=984487 RepID=A0A1E4SPA5_9ASCO|nr:polyadenylation factor subunit 2 [Suhomyces tanzawaensis NRRL Y-17324]ODV81343.1 polyadenylation factor subunit 2 [Suhomyces tanzawaensis NRRL Y-17324]